MHPNEEKSIVDDISMRRPSYLLNVTAQHNSWVDSKFVKWFLETDEKRFRPWLIYKYDLKKIIAEDRYEDLVKSQIRNNESIDRRMELVQSFNDPRFGSVSQAQG